jgi:hypothetical protein
VFLRKEVKAIFMKSAATFVFFLFLNAVLFPLKAQDNGGMQTLAGNINHSGGYGALIFKSSSFKDKSMIFMGGRGVWTINRVFGIGFEGDGIIPINTYEGIDPDGNYNAYLVGGYGGLVLEPIVWSNKLVHITFPVMGGAGWLGYVRDWESTNYHPSESDLYDEDIFWFIEPGASIEVNVTRFFRVDIGVTQRFTQDLQLVNTSSSAFDKTNFSFALKFGSF